MDDGNGRVLSRIGRLYYKVWCGYSDPRGKEDRELTRQHQLSKQTGLGIY